MPRPARLFSSEQKQVLLKPPFQFNGKIVSRNSCRQCENSKNVEKWLAAV